MAVRRGALTYRSRVLGSAFASILSACLLAGSAAAQQKLVPPSDAGASAQTPKLAITARPELVIVGSSTMKGYIDATTAVLQRDYEVPPPNVTLKGSKVGIAQFCEGVGAEFPDIVAASRGMHKDEFDRCVENGVLDIIEIKIGLSALYVVAKNGNEAFNATPPLLFRALAAQLPKRGEFEDNESKTWREVDKEAPNLPIRV